MRNKVETTLTTAVLVGLLAGVSNAAIIAQYNFTGGSAASTDGETNSVASDMTKPASSDWGFSGSTNTAYARSNATTASEAAAIVAGDYFGFTVSPDFGYEMSLAELSFTNLHNNTGGGTSDTGAQMSFFVRSSANGFASNIGPTFTLNYGDSVAEPPISLADPAFQAITAPTEFRLYVYDSGIDLFQNGGRYDNVLLQGTVGLIGSTTSSTSFQEGASPTVAYTHDAVYIRQTQADVNQNGDGDQEMIVGFTHNADEMRALLEFDISAIPATDTIDSVSLILRTESPQGGQGGDITINVYQYGFDIDEATATWNAPGAGDPTPGGTLGALLGSSSFDPTAQGVDVAFTDALFNAAVEDALNGDGYLRLLLARSDNSGSGNRFARFDDETVSTLGFRPELIISHAAPIPEPATVSLLALGGLSLLRRRRTR